MKISKVVLILILLLNFSHVFSQWQVMNSGTTENLVDGCCLTDSVGFIISSGGLVLKTTDQGSTWNISASLSGDFTSICNSGPDTIYAGGNCIYRSTNQGTTWTLMTTFNYTIYDLIFFRGGDGFSIVPDYTTCTWNGQISYFGADYVQSSSDGGATWNEKIWLGEAGNFDRVNDNVAFVTGGAYQIIAHCGGPWYNTSQKTTNKGSSWSYFGLAQYGSYLYSFFAQDTGYNIGYFISDSIYKTVDGGNTWKGSYSEVSGWVDQCLFINEINGYLLGDHAIYITRSNGFAWDQDAATSDTLNFLFKNNSNILFAIGTNGLILKKHHINSPHQDTIFRIKLTSSSIDFGYLAVDSVKTRPLTLKNTGTFPVTLTLVVSDPYKISLANGSYTDSLHVALNLFRDTTVNIRFSPSAAVSYPDSLRIISDSINTVKVPLTGNGFYGLYSDILKDTLICTDTLRIGADIAVANAARLTICAGTQVKFMGNFSLTINGILEALGDSLHPIHFEAKDPLTLWSGIDINHQDLSDTTVFRYCTMTDDCMNNTINIKNGSVLIDHCTISNGYNPENYWFSAAAVKLDTYSSAGLIMTNNKIFNTNGWAIICNQGNQSCFLNNEIYGNSGGIAWLSNNGVTISGNRIYNNKWTGITGGWNDIHGIGPVLIQNNKIYKNGGGIEWSGYSFSIKNNEIFNNEFSNEGGIWCQADSGVFIIQNLVYNNSVTNGNGGGIHLEFYYSDNTKYSLINNTICNNRVMSGGKGNDVYALAHDSGPELDLFNNIIFNLSDTNNISWSPVLRHTFDFNCIHQANAGSIGTNTITAYPGFVWPTDSTGVMKDLGNYNWGLTGNSPCINAGAPVANPYLSSFDFTGNPRVNQDRIDIGVYEYPFPFSVNNNQSSAPFSVFPNPVDDLLYVIVNSNRQTEFSLFDISSRKVLQKKFIHNVSLDCRQLSAGIYLYQLKDDLGTIHKGKVVKK